MTTPNMIAAYIHCKLCTEEKRSSKLAVGLTVDGMAVQIWCDHHDTHVGLLPLRDPVQHMICDECGQPLGEGHKHKH